MTLTFPTRAELAAWVEAVLDEITDTLVRGEAVMFTGFGRFVIQHKRERVGRNPKNRRRGFN